MNFKPTYKPFGKKAILIEWSTIIDVSILKDCIQFKAKIIENKQDDIIDIIIAYNSLTVKYAIEILDFKKEVASLQSIYKNEYELAKKQNFLWKIPVCYDTKFGIDLEEVSIKNKLSIEDIIKLHSEKIYTVFFIGFLPGFLYLGGLPQQLWVHRKSTPRLQVAKGSVAIGGKQTGVYPSMSAGGWNIIGKTPVNFFNVEIEKPCFASSGDAIQFTSITLDEFYKVDKEVREHTYRLSKTLVDD